MNYERRTVSFFHSSFIIHHSSFFILALLILSGCAASVMDSMNEAHRAMAAAQLVQADKYAPVPMTLATRYYKQARDNFIKNTPHDNKMAKHFANQATAQARKAERQARARAAALDHDKKVRERTAREKKSAEKEEENRRKASIEEENRKKEKIRKIKAQEALQARRYIALAQRRLKHAALSKTRSRFKAGLPAGKLEIEVWVAPNGQVSQILILQGNPNSPLARTVLQGLKGFKLDPFPPGMNHQYLKLRLTIDLKKKGKRARKK